MKPVVCSDTSDVYTSFSVVIKVLRMRNQAGIFSQGCCFRRQLKMSWAKREFLTHEQWGVGKGLASGVRSLGGGSRDLFGTWFLFTSQLFPHVLAAVPGSTWWQDGGSSLTLLGSKQWEWKKCIFFITKNTIFVSWALEVSGIKMCQSALASALCPYSWRCSQHHFPHSRSKMFSPHSEV